MCQLKKNRIKIKANFIARANIRELVKLKTDNWCDIIIDKNRNHNNKSNTDCANVNLAEFQIYIKIFLADYIRKTCCRSEVNNHINSSKIDIITTLTINSRSEIFFDKDNFILIYYLQLDGLEKIILSILRYHYIMARNNK